jgi:phosphatidylinositol glycan class S
VSVYIDSPYIITISTCRCFDMTTRHEESTSAMAEAKGSEFNGSVVPSHAVEQAGKRKEPPPERPEGIRKRLLVIFSFWAIVLFLGLPIWWRTTTIYRARLPLDQMMDWAEGRVGFALNGDTIH